MKPLNRKTALKPYLKKSMILQFGGGNFLRAYFDWMIDLLNEKTSFDGGVVIVKPTKGGDYEDLRAQDGLFHVAIKGVVDGSSISEIRLINAVNSVIHPYNEWDA